MSDTYNANPSDEMTPEEIREGIQEAMRVTRGMEQDSVSIVVYALDYYMEKCATLERDLAAAREESERLRGALELRRGLSRLHRGAEARMPLAG